ncbi:CPBP family glutamic-type intramembrane protease [Brachybacterium tyrofermentans]|uniref:CPBP family glutamic-type intramembrane protease n=1 Tax=Brachybacterium tyrofermentans TaxID=47848 RepID=UPI003FD66DA4
MPSKNAARAIRTRRKHLTALRLFSTPIEPHGWQIPPTVRLIPLWVAVLVTFAFYAVGWFRGLVVGLRYAISPWDPSEQTFLDVLVELVPSAGLILLAVVTLWMLARLTGQSLAQIGLAPAPRVPRWHAAAVGAVALALITGVKLLGAAVPFTQTEGYPHNPIPDWPTALLRVVDAALGGAAEEFALLAVPVLALRAAGVRWRWIYGLTVVLRISFHIYYGLPFTLLMALWALGLVLLYQFTGRIWGLFVAHALHNALAAISVATSQIIGDAAGELVLIVVSVATIAICLFALVQLVRATDGYSAMKAAGFSLSWRPTNRQPRKAVTH